MKEFGLPESSRLKLETDFKRVFEEGRKAVTRELAMWWVTGRPSKNGRRIGIVVGRRHGGAVTRNRLKRLIREAFRLNKGKLGKGTEIIICPRAGSGLDDFRSAEKALLHIWTKAGLCEKNQDVD